MNRTSIQKMNKKMQDVNNIIKQLDLTDIWSSIHHQQNIYCTWDILQDKLYVRPKNNLINLKRLKSYKVSSPAHDGIKQDINKRRKIGSFTNTWKITYSFVSSFYLNSLVNIHCNILKLLERNNSLNSQATHW